ncbi:gamma-glutamylcyclotransferase [Photobacterium japonica]|uniref:gamma-glutamylcyclotransferase family protein n=1 Tax=Photobacterium japonica TaxID=2910235 RepID=UPI003D098D1E
MLIFAYGTLRAGESNAQVLTGAQWRGACRLPTGYRLFDLGDYPAAVEDSAERGLSGEVYAITSAHLVALDILEAYPDEYDRVPVMTPWGEAWIYLYNGSLIGAPLIESGDWCQRAR